MISLKVPLLKTQDTRNRFEDISKSIMGENDPLDFFCFDRKTFIFPWLKIKCFI